jgi:hypothetical protein
MKLVEVVDHKRHGLLERVQVGDKALDERLPAKVRGGSSPRYRFLPGGVGKGVGQGKPKALRVLFPPIDRNPAHLFAEAPRFDA